MERNMERWYNAVGQRFSVRKYAGAPSEEDMKSLFEVVSLLSARGVRIVLMRSESFFAKPLLGQGRISGTDCLAAIVSNGAAPETAGYLGETFALECAAMGLGTCWLGMAHFKRAAMKELELGEGEKLRIVMAFGIPAEKYAGRPRKNLDKLTGLTREELIALPEWQQRALECARLAPSAVNAQPWAFIPNANGVTVRRVNENFGYAGIDCGIAMLHIELGAAHCGVSGEWERTEGGNLFRPVS
ncbi:MAG: nitroreductase family protein [Clostridiaceae bacterium]|nr:nitroreductase family protein [Eubacteriales bacterium]